MIQVSAGIIRREDGLVLICQRGEGRSNAHLWEFPGGKLEAGESPCDCLRRELMEELSLPISNLRKVCQQQAQGILFHFIEGTTDAAPVLTEHEACAFVRCRDMLNYAFCPADTAVAQRLALNDPPLRHFFWDFDGTLMDTYPAMTEALLKTAADHGMSMAKEEALALLKSSLSHGLNALGGNVAELAADFRRYERELLQRMIRPVPGIPQALASLPGKHYLVTHRERDALDYLEAAGLRHFFIDSVTGDDGFPRKPAPDGLFHLMNKHGLNPEECVMIGDRPLDTAAGRNAGMLSCLLDVENRFPDDPCQLRVSSGWELAELLCPGGSQGAENLL